MMKQYFLIAAILCSVIATKDHSFGNSCSKICATALEGEKKCVPNLLIYQFLNFKELGNCADQFKDIPIFTQLDMKGLEQEYQSNFYNCNHCCRPTNVLNAKEKEKCTLIEEKKTYLWNECSTILIGSVKQDSQQSKLFEKAVDFVSKYPFSFLEKLENCKIANANLNIDGIKQLIEAILNKNDEKIPSFEIKGLAAADPNKKEEVPKIKGLNDNDGAQTQTQIKTDAQGQTEVKNQVVGDKKVIIEKKKSKFRKLQKHRRFRRNK